MGIKIEKMPLKKRAQAAGSQRELVDALAKLKIGESFMFPLVSNHRTAISIVQHLMTREFTTRKEGESFRVARVG